MIWKTGAEEEEEEITIMYSVQKERKAKRITSPDPSVVASACSEKQRRLVSGEIECRCDSLPGRFLLAGACVRASTSSWEIYFRLQASECPILRRPHMNSLDSQLEDSWAMLTQSVYGEKMVTR